jgi:ABC-type glycerol-3-phosphate transport system substrate-binding protein
MIAKKKLVTIFSVAFGALLLSGCGFKSTAPEGYLVDLEIWGVFDDTDAYQGIFGEYRKINPYIRTLQYRKMPVETYKEDLLDALASGKGPDIFMIRNSWRGAFEDKIVPAPETMLTEKRYRDTLVDAAATDFIGSDQKIYGIPVSVDSLGLYYNKDLLNAAGITRPPVTWEEVLAATRKINRLDQNGNILQSGIALGTAYNINRSTDILAAMMMQLGAKMADPQNGRADFSDDAAKKALEFYTRFASEVGSDTYSWNKASHYSIDAFTEGTLGMMVNYSWQYATLKQKNAKLNIGVALLPQFAGAAPANMANYWGYAVAKNKQYQAPSDQENVAVDLKKWDYLRVHEAWQYLTYFALPHEDKAMTLVNGITGTGKVLPVATDPADTYLKITMKPAARRDLIAVQQNDTVLAPFASGNLIAKNWYQGNPEAADGILAEMIDAVNTGAKSAYDALLVAATRLNTLRR